MDNKLVVKSPQEMIALAIEKGADLDKLSKMLDLQEKWDAQQAKKAYHKAMAAFKENPPSIEKDKHVKFSTSKGTMDYHHASLANVCEKINKALSPHGLSAAWKTKQNGMITVTCVITHELGHSEEVTLSGKEDNTGLKNSIQAMASTVNYLQRYTILLATGLAAHDQVDDDGRSSEETSLLTPDQVIHLKNMITDTGANLKRFLDYAKVEKIEEIAAADYKKMVSAIENSAKINETDKK